MFCVAISNTFFLKIIRYKKIFGIEAREFIQESYNETDHWPWWVAHTCSILSNLDRYSHKIILY
jgi:hypothetical protein